ncbi:MAG: HEAT repeat domain-containing protein [Planctomycetota bacterium]|nr:HEAT repeat domain-containing protein [Planctomycetota bacterium]
MSRQRKTRTFLFSLVCGFLVTALATASDPPGTTPVAHESQWWVSGQGGSLGTTRYSPSKKEQPFFGRLPADELVTGSHADGYDISTKDDKYVGWFGIVRGIAEDAKANRTILTVEHKYFDGLTDAHLQAVSFNGSGDFLATLTGTGHRIPPLSLVKVYGTVAKGKPGTLPRMDAAFVRNWHWGTFTFLAAYGTQQGSEQWRKANQIPVDQIYEAWPHPCHHYYEERLGKRPDAPQIRQRLLDAAGPLSPEARHAMERLADLLALGHTWSQAETIRQSGELSQICKLVKTTGAHKAAIDLLLQALQENDERVSWSASEKFADFDLAGEAIGNLVKLLEHETPRVRAGAVRALSSGYGAKAAPAVAALSRCVAETDSAVKQYAVLALSDIGPGAKAAVPALKNALTDEDQGTRVNVAKTLWRIDREPDDVISVLAAVLENGDDGERYEAAEQLKEMGSWAAPAVPALIKALDDKEWPNRCKVAEALREIGPQAATAIPALTKALQNDEESSVRSHAAEALGKLGGAETVPMLIAALDSEDDSVRWSTVGALETLGHRAKAAVPALMRAVKNDQANGWIAASALGAIDEEGISTPVLIETLGAKDSRTRRFAAIGLSGIGRKAVAAEKALYDGLRDSDPGARIAAAAAYWSVSGKADDPVRVLRSVLQTPDRWAAQMWAADALAEIGAAARPAVPELIACLKSDTRYVATSSAKALGKIGPDAVSAVPALTAQVEESDDHYTRVCMARALWRINRSARTLPALQDALTNSRDSMAVSEAARAFGEMGAQATGSVALLRPLLKDSNSFVRNAAAEALKQFDRK